MNAGQDLRPTAIVSLEVSEGGGAFVTVDSMPLRPAWLLESKPLESCAVLLEDAGPGGTFHLGLVEEIGGEPIDVLTVSTIGSRTYRITMAVEPR